MLSEATFCQMERHIHIHRQQIQLGMETAVALAFASDLTRSSQPEVNNAIVWDWKDEAMQE